MCRIDYGWLRDKLNRDTMTFKPDVCKALTERDIGKCAKCGWTFS